MTIDITKFNATVEAAKAKGADSPAWLRAIEKAAVALQSCQRPTLKSWVIVDRTATGELVLERFRGQPFICVVRWLNNYFTLPAWRAQSRQRIAESARRRMLDVRPAAEAPPKERNPFPRVLAC